MKDKIKQLEQQVQNLQQLVEQQNKTIELILSVKQSVVTIPQIQTPPYIAPCQWGQHDYPSPWFGIFPPACRRCGHQVHQYQITCSPAQNPHYYTTIGTAGGTLETHGIGGAGVQIGGGFSGGQGGCISTNIDTSGARNIVQTSGNLGLPSTIIDTVQIKIDNGLYPQKGN